MSVYNNTPLVIPDIILVDTLNLAIDAIREDYVAHETDGTIQESFLYLLLNSLGIGRYNLIKNAVEIFGTTPEHPKHIDKVKLSYDHNSSKSPAVFVTLPSENDRNNSLQVGSGDQEPLYIGSDSEDDQYREQYMRRYFATYQVVIICENRNEMIVLYHVIKSLLTASIGHLTIEGLQNIKLGGQDLRLSPVVSDKLFTRAITISFEYEQVIPSLFIKNIFRTIRLYWKPEGATTAQGPIEVSTEDDLGSDESESFID